MAENINPNSGSSATPAAAADQPGRPYYESLRSTLRQTLDKKRKFDDQLAILEEAIFKAEGNYLEETASSGNIVRGFDGWVKGVAVGGRNAMDDRRRGRVRDEDRVFSRSSAQEGPDSNSTSHAPTPTGSYAPQLSAREASVAASAVSAAKPGNKKKRPTVTDKDDDDDGKSVKRGKISYSRD